MSSCGHEVFFATSSNVPFKNHFKIKLIRGNLKFLMFKRTVFFNQDPLARQSLREVLKKLNPDLVHCHNLYHISLAPVSLSIEMQIPCIVTLHDYWPVCLNRALVKPDLHDCQESFWTHCAFGCKHRRAGIPIIPFVVRGMHRRRRILEEGSFLVSVSKFVKDALGRFGYSSRRIHVIHNGVDTEIFRPNETKKKEKMVLFVGPSTEPKGIMHFAKAVRQIKSRFPDARALAIGGVPFSQVGESIEFTGRIPRKDLPEYYAAATCVCVPSLIPESYSMVAAEAMSCGTPVVAYRTGGLTELVEHGTTGFLANVGNWRELAFYATKLIEDREKRREFSRNSRRRIERYFSIEEMRRHYSNLYDQVDSHGTSYADYRV